MNRDEDMKTEPNGREILETRVLAFLLGETDEAETASVEKLLAEQKK